MSLDTIWTELETEAQGIVGTGILKRMLAPDSACTMFLGVQRPTLNRLFLLQAPRTLLPSREQIPQSRGFELTVQITGEEAHTDATFVLSTTDRMYNEIFSAMADNLFQSLQTCKEQRHIVHLFLERLVQWQQFLEKNDIAGLSEEAQRGLYGELHFLRNHILSTAANFAAEISGWTGPKKRQHDFQYPHAAIEVKTSSAKQHQKLFISSEQQLDEALVENLFLFHLSLSSVENHADTLPAIVRSIRDLLKLEHHATSLFETALLESGYLDVQAWRYQKTGYVLRESNAFRVTADFPRLTERDLPPGVGDLSYSISVADCRKFTVPVANVIAHIRESTS